MNSNNLNLFYCDKRIEILKNKKNSKKKSRLKVKLNQRRRKFIKIIKKILIKQHKNPLKKKCEK